MTIQKIKIELDTRNDNFNVDMNHEVKAVLRRCLTKITNEKHVNGNNKYPVKDTNGNKIGTITVNAEVFSSFDETNYTGDPKFNWDNEDGQEGMMENYAPYSTLVKNKEAYEPKTVWTIFDAEDGLTHIKAGMNPYDSFMYFISNEKWESSSEEYIWGI